MAERIVSGASTNLGLMELVREGMTVVDSEGKKIGKVEGVKMGDPGVSTEQGNELQDTGLLGDIEKAFVGDEREPDVPPAVRARLLRSGYIKVDLDPFGTDRYVMPEQLHRIDGDTIHLRAMKDQLIKED